MNAAIAWCVIGTFVAAASWHFALAFLPTAGAGAAVPLVDGKPLFVPSPAATAAVGCALLLCAVLVAATGALIDSGVSPFLLRGLSFALALGLLARAIGDFRYVGFFKRVRSSRFATLDTRLYSPLCLLLSAGVAAVARQNGG